MASELDLYIIELPEEEIGFVNETVQVFNSAQKEYRLVRREVNESFGMCQLVSWSAAKALLKRQLELKRPTIVVTGVQFDDNWFSHCDGRLTVTTTHGWQRHFAPPCLQSYLIHEFTQAAALMTGNINEDTLKPHEDTTGCDFDLTEKKWEIKFKLQAGYLCGTHVDLLRQFGVTMAQISAIERLLNVMRAYALGRESEKRMFGAFTGNKVFVIHGRDLTALGELTTLLESMGIDPVAIIDEPTQGRTIIEQIEEHARVGYAFVLMTPDDEGRLRTTVQWQERPRQNVVFEYGFFAGYLGRRRVCCIAKGTGLETPSDLAGIMQLRFESSLIELRAKIEGELKAAGYAI